jgi:hypothetical protein
MKALVFVLSMLVAGSAVAGTNFEAMSWDTILRSAKYEPDYATKIHFQNGSVWRNIWSDNLCTDGTFIYGGLFEKKYCVSGGDDSCNRYETKVVDLIQPIYSTRQRCAKYQDDDCVKYVTVNYVQRPTQNVKIYGSQYSPGDDDNHRPLGVKSYTIPSCGGAPKVPAN